MNYKFIALLLFIPAATACTTMVAPNRVLDISSVGGKYVKTLKEINDLAMKNSIEFTADKILPNVPRNREILEKTTDAFRERAKLIQDAHNYLDKLVLYFSELEALAKDDQSEATAEALGRVVESLKKAPVELELSEQKKEAVTGLGAFVTKQFHAAAVAKALARDADVVAEALALSEEILDEQIRWISLREENERKRQFNKQVVNPFLEGKPLDENWKTAWSNGIQLPVTQKLLIDAKKASVDMQNLWRNILRGQYSYAEIDASLDNVKRGIQAITAFKEAQ